MKRYLVFKGENYYPSKGMGDWVCDFDSLEEAIESAKILFNADPYFTWALVYDGLNRMDVWDETMLEETNEKD